MLKKKRDGSDEMNLTNSILEYIDAHAQEAFDLLLTLAQIPAPSHHEEQRAQFCRDWLERQGARGVYIDEALNVVWPVGCEEPAELAVFMAHSDVVFPDREPLPLRIEAGRIYCPVVGDDTANVVAMLMAAKYVAEHKLVPRDRGVLFVIDSCEEGLGNLKGCRRIMEQYGGRIAELIALDAHDARGVSHAVGSKRFRIVIETEGGHSFTNFGRANAIAQMAELISALYAVEVPSEGKTTYNVGAIHGGTTINSIAAQAELLYEFRSDTGSSMEQMQQQFEEVIRRFREKGYAITVELVGDRPCSGDVDEARQQALMRRAARAVQNHYGREVVFESGSTDCNVSLAMGIPSVCVGCYNGAGSHTRGEYVEIDSLLPGLRVAFELVLHDFEEASP